MLQVRHILLVRLSSVGDIILATPVAAALRTAFPAATLSWLVDAPYLDLVSRNPHIDQAMVYDYLGQHRGLAGIQHLCRQLGPVDLLVDLQHKVRTVLLSSYLRPARRKVLIKRSGLGLIKAALGRDSILGAPHQQERYLSVIRDEFSFPIEPPLPILNVDAEDLQRAEALMKSECLMEPWVGLIPAARHHTKCWPVQQTARFADRCHQAGLRVALLGSEADRLLAQAVVDLMKTRKPWLQTGGTLGMLAGLISRCSVVVSPDSGPAHMAAALGVPVVTLFGPTSSERWAPLGPGSRIVKMDMACSPCSNHGSEVCPLGTRECMQALTVERVWQETEMALNLKPGQFT